MWCELPPDARSIIEAQPRRGDRIFPYSTDAIGAAFTRACRLLGIEDLRFHDLRHSGISRLFELGRTIPQVACVSAHRSLSSLKRYAHIRQSGDRLAGWKWLAVASISAQMVTGLTVTRLRAVETLHGTARGDIDANQARGYPRYRRKEPPVSQGGE
jgi:hypothetical protein